MLKFIIFIILFIYIRKKLIKIYSKNINKKINS